jgi:hypothetical protein
LPLGAFIAEVAAQATIQLGGEGIAERYGWKGCVATIAIIAVLVALAFWYFTG